MKIEQQKTNAAEQLWQGMEDAEIGKFGIVLNEHVQQKGVAKDELSTGSTTTVNLKDVTYPKPDGKETESAVDQMKDNAAMSAKDRKDQMAVLSNTTSEEDYAKMQEDGFDIESTTGAVVVTETDKIKAQLAKAGVDISIFGDDPDMEELTEIAGSTELAAQIAAAMRKADLPLTEDNLKESVDALRMADSLEMPSQGAMRYLVEQDIAPTIENLYFAEHSGDSQYMPQGQTIDFSDMTEQIEQVIEQAGYEVAPETVADAKWLIENQVAFTPDRFSYYEELKGLSFPMDREALLSAITQAVSDGAKPQNALLIEDDSMYEQAKDAMDVIDAAQESDLDYLNAHDMTINISNLRYAESIRLGAAAPDGVDEVAESGDEQPTFVDESSQELAQVTAHRQLEETRLMMTIEANYALLKRGISIDTVPLAQLVEELKSEEEKYYGQLLEAQGVDASEENVSTFKNTMEQLEEIKSVPAYVLGIQKADVSTINGVHEVGMELKDTFERANARYETLMTAPRADLGDDIKKAFRNVDDLLDEIGLERTEANERAVRILAYNETEIDPESVARMKLADEQVQRVFKQMTPAVVTEMIREEINPLDMDFEALSEVSEQMGGQLGESDAKKFGEYLWKLEQKHEIKEDERESYIGIYRLIHQVERTDGAAVGALVNQGAPITMRNLLMAVRSENRSGRMDYRVDEAFGNVEGNLVSSITEQAEAAYQTACLKDAADALTPDTLQTVLESDIDWEELTPEQLKEALESAKDDETGLDRAYAAEQLSLLEECADASEEIYEQLEHYDIPVTVSHVLAMNGLMKDRNQVFRKLFEEDGEELAEEFMDALSSKESMEKAEEHLENTAEEVVQTSLLQDGVTSLDVRELRMLSAQIDLSRYMAREEHYSVPMQTSDGIINVSLKLVRGTGQKGVVDIAMETEHGKIAASFRAGEKGISGLIATDDPDTEQLLAEQYNDPMDWEEETKLQVAYMDDLDLNRFSGVLAKTEDGTSEESAYEVQTKRLYGIAENFIRSIRDLL